MRGCPSGQTDHIRQLTMWKAALLTFGLLVALVDTVRGNDVHPSFYGVKLSPAGEEIFDPWKTNTVPQLTSEQDPTKAQAWKRQMLDVASLAAGFSRPAPSADSEEVMEALKSEDRKQRDAVVGLSNACCKWGCSKSEISSLC
ncbi:unnamed protein product [Menidia menidia]|uniref:(Atlantic silverside) hypothetical protein n=1 Tax=Menidia menidia TaxID=238744 RepID=A0A8S4B3S4_9TELE|nr:unnamed protein product [Menidia menidia]